MVYLQGRPRERCRGRKRERSVAKVGGVGTKHMIGLGNIVIACLMCDSRLLPRGIDIGAMLELRHTTPICTTGSPEDCYSTA